MINDQGLREECPLIEIYLFVNPIGERCLSVERKVLNLIEQQELKVQLRLIPLMNLYTISDVMKHQGTCTKNIKARNQLSKDIYAASLDFKAAQLQGKKRGRDFLIRLQEEVGVNGQRYSKKLAQDLIQEVGGDLEMFIEDRESEFVSEAFLSDQQIAHEMKIKCHPSAVIYNYACDLDFGVLVEGCESIEHIAELCQTKEATLQFFNDHKAQASLNEQKATKRHLYLV